MSRLSHNLPSRSAQGFVAGALLLLGAVAPRPAVGTPYWISWDGSDGWPETAGFRRLWGDAQGYWHGPGAVRTLEDGVLTYDALNEPGVFDFYAIDRPGQMDPQGSSEVFTIEWRLKIDAVNDSLDPGVAFCSDEAWAASFYYGIDHVNIFHQDVDISFVPYVWHEYQVVSGDMRNYQFFIDGALVHNGTFTHLSLTSLLDFGETSVTDGGLHHWDYFRFGVVPEPGGFVLLMWVCVWRVAIRTVAVASGR